MGVFGWDLPPGCSIRDIDEHAGAYAECELCKHTADNCTCPECPECGECGNPACYLEHGLKREDT